MVAQPVLGQINLAVKNMGATIAFYQKLGLEVEGGSNDVHGRVRFPNGFSLEIDTVELVNQYDTHPKSGPGSVILGFLLESREAVDALYAEMVAVGYQGHQSPYDGFWGARFAIIDDPDGYAIGLMSPRDPQYNFWPPKEPPAEL